MPIKYLLIVESPGKIKKIKGFLGDDWEVKASIGHICDLPKKELGIDKENGFKPTYIISEDKKDVVSGLKSVISKVGKENVYLATDPDREGEAISFHLCRNLGLDYKTTKRITFQEITKEAVLKAVSAPRTVDIPLVSAQEARRIIDRLVGFEISPILWRKVKSDTPLSAGRVQSVALKLVVEREREILNFGATSNFKVSGVFLTPENNKLKAYCPTDYNDSASGKQYLETLTNKKFSITSIVQEPKKTQPQAPFSTSTLQQDANKKLKFPVAKTMEVAQKLYEGGHITYMRTDSVNLSDSSIQLLSEFIKNTFGSDYLENRKFKNKSDSAQEAHEAIRPSYFEKTDIEGTDDEKSLYNLIYLRAVASQMRAKETAVTTITINSETLTDEFKAKASIVTFDGFTKAYSEVEEETDEDDENVEIKENLKEGSSVGVHSFQAKQTYSKPKQRFGEAELVKELETLGIGRPSTYASIMKNIKDSKGYIFAGKVEGVKVDVLTITLENGSFKEQKGTLSIGAAKDKLLPNPIAYLLIDFLQEGFSNIMDYKFTAKCEDNFDAIAENKDKYVSVVSSFYSELSKNLSTVDSKHADIEGKERKTIEIGDYEGKKISAGKGEHGVYVRHNDNFYSIKELEDVAAVTLDVAINAIKEKKDKDKILKEQKASNTLYTFGKFKIINGQWGPYMEKDNDKVSIPKWDLDKLDTYDENKCKEVWKAQKDFAKKKDKAKK